MEPRIQYAQTADGVSIAFWTLGEGVPVVYMPNLPWTHIQLEWDDPDLRAFYERLADRGKLVRYDSRGSGLSERHAKDYSLDAHLLDLEAVVDRLGLDRFALCAVHSSGPVAITYAASHPERMSHLVLRSSYARSSEAQDSPLYQGLVGLLDKDWELFTETTARLLVGWSDEMRARRVAARLRECVTQDAALAMYGAIGQFDVSALLPQVGTPTLVIHMRQYRYPEIDMAKGLVAQIPDARLAIVPDLKAAASAIEDFLGEGEEVEAAAEPTVAGGFRTILFTDMEGSTTLTQRVGDAKAQEVLRTHNSIVRDALKAHTGSEVKHTGDGIMASFASASRALECAIAMQRAFAKHNESAEEPIRVRIGLNAGEPIAEEEDLFGTAVQLAARVCARAVPGQILASNVVRELAAGKGFLFADRGDTALRGFEDPVRLYELRWESLEKGVGGGS